MPTKPSSSTRPSRTTKKKAPAARKVSPVKEKAPRVSTKRVATKKEPIVLVAVKKPARNFHLGIQFAIAGSAIAVLLLLAAFENNIFVTKGSDAAAVPVTIGLEHDAPLSLSILFAKKENAGYVSLQNTSSESIHISVPSNWVRSEVTGAELKDVTQDIPVFGFTRYALPAGAGMKMLLSEAPGAVFFDSTSDAVTAIDLKSIDLMTSKVSSKVVLIQKQSLISLWTDVE